MFCFSFDLIENKFLSFRCLWFLYFISFDHKINYRTFKASSSWVYRWKKKHNVVSRKITKTLSRQQIASLPNVSEKVEEYREQVQNLVRKYKPSQVFNTDQSGFNIEFLSGRTLTKKGEKLVYASINQSHSETHSYTIQPTICMDGSTIDRLLIVLQEKGGEFGPYVKEKLFTHPEIFVTSTTSGKVTKTILKDWFIEVYFPTATDKSLLILDSFPTYKDRALIDKEKPRKKSYEVSTIPPGLTGYCQPLDVFYFRPYKSFHRHLSDHINFHEKEIELHKRNTILKLQACTFFQFRSPRFQNFIKYAWFKAGLSNSFDRSIRFNVPKQYCFNDDNILHKCSAPDCSKNCFIRCSWCSKFLCFEHFFTSPICKNDQEFLQFHYCLKFKPD